MSHFETEQWVSAPLSPVFRFFCDPGNLPVLSPPAARARLLRADLKPLIINGLSTAGLAGTGSEVLISVRILPPLPLRATWLARITEVVWEQYFADIQVKGPFARWHHRHEFRAETRTGSDRSPQGGTVVRDVVDYEAPLGPLGKIANHLFLRNQVEAMFAHRQRALAKVFPG